MVKLKLGSKLFTLKVPVFINKSNGQVSLALPKKKIKYLLDKNILDINSKEIKISLWKNYGS